MARQECAAPEAIRGQNAEVARLRRQQHETAARGAEVELADLVREWDHDAMRRVSTNDETPAEAADLAPIRAACLTGDLAKIKETIAQHNAKGLEPVFLHDDPELAKRGIALRARWDHAASFGVVLQAHAPDATEPCTILVAPGAIVKSGGDGYQDTAPIQARFIHIAPREPNAEATANICCAQIHSEDPRALPARGLTSHKDPRVALVAAAAEREHASWGAAQVAIWAVANDVTEDEVASAPGAYTTYIDPARDVLEKAGIDTNKLPLYAKASPLPRRSSLELDLIGRVRGG